MPRPKKVAIQDIEIDTDFVDNNEVASELISDLETLTGLKMNQWKVKINHEKGDASEEFITSQLALSPKEYAAEHDEELNELIERSIEKYPDYYKE